MRALIAIAALATLAACSSTPTRAPEPEPVKIVTPQDAMATARAQNHHFLAPELAGAFPATAGNDYRPPAQLAVLLPQSGEYALASRAIRDGLLAAYYAEPRSKPSIRFYDTRGTAEGVKSAYLQATQEGAQLIIGPIAKDEVATMADIAGTVPVLALNALDKPQNRYMLNFALSPEREGELLAERLLAKALLSAGVFHEGGDANARILSAFERRYSQGGGTLIFRAANIIMAKTANGDPINPTLPERLLQAKALVLFMSGDAAKPTRAALALNGASSIPLFAASDITDNSDAKSNSQLDGIEFLQMPWLNGGGNALMLNANQLQKLPSARGPGARLNAFGIDAWMIATRLPIWLNSPNTVMNGATGQLHMGPDGTVQRTLPWWVFRAGIVQAASDQP